MGNLTIVAIEREDTVHMSQQCDGMSGSAILTIVCKIIKQMSDGDKA